MVGDPGPLSTLDGRRCVNHRQLDVRVFGDPVEVWGTPRRRLAGDVADPDHARAETNRVADFRPCAPCRLPPVTERERVPNEPLAGEPVRGVEA